MAKYHKYVFDLENRKLVGDFETMYQNESKENFDSWHQDDARQLQRKIDLVILEDYNFEKIIDLGCGKGNLTHLLKKKNNAAFVFFIITLYAFLGFGLGFIIWEYVL